jgi:hypothetical protein
VIAHARLRHLWHPRCVPGLRGLLAAGTLQHSQSASHPGLWVHPASPAGKLHRLTCAVLLMPHSAPRGSARHPSLRSLSYNRRGVCRAAQARPGIQRIHMGGPGVVSDVYRFGCAACCMCSGWCVHHRQRSCQGCPASGPASWQAESSHCRAVQCVCR